MHYLVNGRECMSAGIYLYMYELYCAGLSDQMTHDQSAVTRQLQAQDLSIETMSTNSTLAKIVTKHGVPACGEFRRIDRLPRRVWSEADKQYAVKHMTAEYRTANGRQTLWPDQATSLVELHENNGLVGGIRVSGGKSTISFLAATVLGKYYQRPLLILPTKSIRTGKVRDAWTDAEQHWRLRNDVSWTSYEFLQRKENAEYLFTYRPQILILDEAHHAGRYDSSRTKRISRYLAHYPDTIVIALSGSLIASHVVADSIKLCAWALRTKSPLPLPHARATAKFWSMALEQPSKLNAGALHKWQSAADQTVLRGVGRRYTETPGVITSSGDSVIGTSLVLEPQTVEIKDSKILRAFELLRQGKLEHGGELIDCDGSATWNMAQTLALGFYLRADPEPPEEWTEAFRNFAAYCREVIADGELDTAGQVEETYKENLECWPVQDWLNIKNTYKRVNKTIWLSDERVIAAQKWMREHPLGIVWTQHPSFGERLKPYYGRQATDQATKALITSHVRGKACAASIKVCSEDLNLQYQFAHNLFISPPATGAWQEQAIARTHRFGQPEPVVTVEYWIACIENLKALDTARMRERLASSMTHDPNRKLLLGEWLGIAKKQKGPQWTQTTATNKAVMI